MQRHLAPFFTLLFCIVLFSSCKNRRAIQIEPRSLENPSLRVQLAHEIDNHVWFTYRELWKLFPQTDVLEGDVIWDIYAFDGSENPDPDEQPYTYTVLMNQCGNYRQEGDCYNREHSFPKSWWGRAKDTMYSDLFHIYPTDGYVNNMRGSFPFGETDDPNRVSDNGCKVGPSSTPGYSGIVFEPIDAYKGDLARTYFYMLTRYVHRIKGWRSPMLSDGDFTPWARRLLLKWHREDPVSKKEIDRNAAIQKLQKNYNPFVVKPELAEEIWGEANF